VHIREERQIAGAVNLSALDGMASAIIVGLFGPFGAVLLEGLRAKVETIESEFSQPSPSI
jgi:hypothetical protein